MNTEALQQFVLEDDSKHDSPSPYSGSGVAGYGYPYQPTNGAYPAADYEADNVSTASTSTRRASFSDSSDSFTILSCGFLSKFKKNTSKNYYTRIIGFLLFVFFLIYEIAVIIGPYNEYQKIKESGEDVLEIPAYIPGMHWFFTVMACLLSLGLCFFVELDEHFSSTVIILVLSITGGVMWIAYGFIGIAPIFEYSATTLSNNQYDQNVIDVPTTQVDLEIFGYGRSTNSSIKGFGSYKDYYYTKSVKLQSISHLDSSIAPDIPSGPFNLYVEKDLEINPDDDVWAKSIGLKIVKTLNDNDVCYVDNNRWVHEWDYKVEYTIPLFTTRQMVRADGNDRERISNGKKYPLLIFWGAAAYAYRTASYPVRHFKVHKTNVDFDTTQYVFKSSDFDSRYDLIEGGNSLR